MRIMTNAMRRTAGALAIAQLWVGLACRGDDGHAGGDGSGSSGTSADTTVASASASSDSAGTPSVVSNNRARPWASHPRASSSAML